MLRTAPKGASDQALNLADRHRSSHACLKHQKERLPVHLFIPPPSPGPGSEQVFSDYSMVTTLTYLKPPVGM